MDASKLFIKALHFRAIKTFSLSINIPFTYFSLIVPIDFMFSLIAFAIYCTSVRYRSQCKIFSKRYLQIKAFRKSCCNFVFWKRMNNIKRFEKLYGHNNLIITYCNCNAFLTFYSADKSPITDIALSERGNVHHKNKYIMLPFLMDKFVLWH